MIMLFVKIIKQTTSKIQNIAAQQTMIDTILVAVSSSSQGRFSFQCLINGGINSREREILQKYNKRGW